MKAKAMLLILIILAGCAGLQEWKAVEASRQIVGTRTYSDHGRIVACTTYRYESGLFSEECY